MSDLPLNEFSNSQFVKERGAEKNCDPVSENSDVESSNSDSDNSDSEDEDFISYDIISNPTCEIDENFIMMLSKENNEINGDDKRQSCKILKFESDLEVDEVARKIKNLRHEEFPNLFIVIVELRNFALNNNRKDEKFNKKIKTNAQKFKVALKKFCKNRPMILQITSLNKNTSIFFFKSSNQKRFQKVKKLSDDTEFFEDFPSFLLPFLNEKIEKFEKISYAILPKVRNSSLIYRFLRALKISANNFRHLVIQCACSGSQNDIMAIMNYPLCSKNDELDFNIKSCFAMQIQRKKGNISVLKNAIENNNNGIYEFIIKNCSKIIGNFDYSFQVDISTLAYEKSQIDFLCDLIDVCDFPFPKNLNIESVTHERLKKIFDERNEFNKAINTSNKDEINKFISSHSNFKFIYNPSNCSALHQAVSAKNMQMLSFLEQLGLQAPEYSDYCEATSDKNSKNTAKQLATKKRNDNVKGASSNTNKAVLLLLSRSFIHNKNITKKTQDEYWNNICKWFENLYSIEENKPHLDVAAQCDRLKIIFDFDSDEVDSIDPLSKGSLGIMYPTSKWIFFGAKYSDENESRESQIKGVIAHETDHYALELYYENGSNPYYKHDEERKKIFEDIINETNVWVEGSVESDECDGIISSVFTHYSSDCYPAELIVRVPHILSQYAGNKEKLKTLETRYKPLFNFYRKYIMSDLKKFRQDVRRFNNFFGKLALIQSCTYEFHTLKDTSYLLCNFATVVLVHIPLLLLLNIHKNLRSKYGNLLDMNCIFIDVENLKNSNIMKELQEIIRSSSELYIIIDCTKGYEKYVKKLDINREVKLTFIVSDEKSLGELAKLMKNCNTETVDYKWEDLSQKTQDELLETKINPQKDPVQIKELIMFEGKNNALEKNGAQDVPSKELLKMLVEKSEINIDESPVEDEKDEKNFNIHFLERRFRKYQTTIEELKDNDTDDKECTQKINQSELQNGEINLDFSPNETKGISMTNDIKTSVQDPNEESYHDVKHSPEQDLKIDMEPKIKVIETKMILTEFLKDIENQQYVLIIDSAGTGKSWITKKMAYIMRKQSPRKWVIRVDLKQFTEHFKLSPEAVVCFTEFMAENILKLKGGFDKKIFINMYTNGRACIFFDGFDEIAPNYVEFVKNLIKSFESNNGNQLWIATRDNFEIDLQKELKLDAVYKLEPFTLQDGIDLITSILVLHDLEAKNELKNEIDIQTQIKNHPDCEAYKKKATDLSRIIRNLNINAIGAPHFYQMIANIFIIKGAEISALTIFKIFFETVNIQYDRWASQKGDIRKQASILSQHHHLNYMRLHQFFAMKGAYPDSDKFYDLVFNTNEWSESEIIACGLLTKKGSEYHFNHETFREFFIAQFIMRILKSYKEHASEEFSKYLCEVLTLPKFEVVRVFLNECLTDDMQEILQKAVKNNKNCGFLLDIYKNNLENLQKMWINYFKSLDYDNIKNILFSDKETMFEIAKDKILCQKFHQLPHAFLKHQDLCEIILIKNEYENNFVHSAVLNNKFEDIKILIENLNEIFEESYFIEIIKSTGQFGRNLLQRAVSNSKKFKTFEFLWNFFRNSFNSDEIFLEFLTKVDSNENNVFILAASYTSSAILKFIIDSLQKMTTSQKIKEFLSSTGYFKRNLLQAAGWKNKSLEFHEFLWMIMRKYFDSDEILEMITYTDENGDNLFHYAVLGDNAEIIEFTWKQISDTVDSCSKIQNKSRKLGEIQKSIGRYGRNLLQKVASNSKNIKTFEFLWNFVRNLFHSDEEFFEFLTKVDSDESNVFNLAASFASIEILKFMIDSMRELTSPQKIKEFLSSTGSSKRNLLQSAGWKNKSLEFHKFLWMIIKTYFNSDEILEMITYTDENGDNLLHYAVFGDNAEIIELTWKEISDTVNSCSKIQNKSSKLEEIQKSKGKKYGRNLLQIAAINSKNTKTFEFLWNFFRNLFNSDEEFLEILTKPDGEGNNIFILTALFASSEIFKLMIDLVKKLTSPQKIKEFLCSTGFSKRNLLQAAGLRNKSLEFHECLWMIMKTYFDCDEILEMITYTDENGDNFLHYVVIGDNSKIIEFTWNEITATVNSCNKIENKLIKLEEILKSKGQYGRNLLQNAASTSRNVKNFEFIWNLFRNLFESNEEFLEFLKKFDGYENNIFDLAALFASSGIFLFMIDLVKELTSTQTIKEFLSSTGSLKRNLLQAAVWKNKSLEFHKCLWIILRTYFNCDEILEMITYTDENGDNLLYYAILGDNAEIIELTWNEITDTINSCDQIKNKSNTLEEIKKSKGKYGLNLLQRATITAKNMKTFEFVWNFLRNLFDADEEFLKFLEKVNQYENNIFDLAASYASSEILKFIIDSLKELTSTQNIRDFLSSTGFSKRNLLQAAGLRNKSLRSHICLWMIMRKYFDSDEILEMITYKDENGDNLLHYAILGDNAEIIELTWNEITATVNSCINIKNKSNKLEEIQKSKGQYGRNLLQRTVITAKNMKTFEFVWNFVRNLFNADEEFLNFLKKVDDYGNNIFDLAASYASSEILKFMIDLLKELTSPQRLREFLSSTGSFKRNLLQSAGLKNKCIELHKCLWMIMRKYFDSDEILKMITHKDNNGDDLLHYAVLGDNAEIIELIWNEINDTVNSSNKITISSSKLEEIQTSKGQYGRNLLQKTASNSKNIKTFEFLWNFFRKFFNSDKKFLEFLTKVDDYENNIFHIAVLFASNEILEFIIDLLKELTTSQKIKEFLSSTGFSKKNLLQTAGLRNIPLEFHKCLWMIMRTYFDSDEILDMITYTDENGDNLFHYAVYGDDVEIIEFTWKEIISSVNFCDKIKNKSSKLEEIQKSKGQYGRNLLQKAASNSKKLKTFEFLWIFFRNSFNLNGEFLEYLEKIDDNKNNIFILAASFTSSEIINFVIDSLKELTTTQKIKEFLSSTGFSKRNLLQVAGFRNKSLEFHKCLWMIIRTYFDSDEILKMITYKDNNGDDLLYYAILGDNAKIIELTWNEMIATINSCNKIKNKSRKLKEIQKSKGKYGRNLLQNAAKNSKNIETFKFIWNFFRSSFNSDEDFLKFMKESDSEKNDMFNLAASFASSEILKLMIDLLKKLTSPQQIKEFLGSTGFSKRNLLQAAAWKNKSLEFHKCLWVIMRTYFNSDEILEMIIYTDENGNNLFHYAVLGDNAVIIELTWNEIIATVNSCDKIKNKSVKLEEIQRSKGKFGRNLLQRAGSISKDLKTFEFLWNFFRNLLNSNEEFLQFLKEVDGDKNNIFNLAASYASSKILKLMIDLLKELTSPQQIKEFLGSTGFSNRNLLQAAVWKNKSLEFHRCLWVIMRTYFDSDEILEMITYTDENGDNLLHYAVLGDNVEIIEFTWKEISYTVNLCSKIKNKSKKLEEIQKSKGRYGQNLLHRVISNSKNLKTFEFIWIFFQNLFNSDEEFLEFLKIFDGNENNIFNLAASFASSEILKVMIDMMKELTTPQKIKEFLSSTGSFKRNLLQAAGWKNKSIEFHKCLWMIMKTYFDCDEILEMITYTDENGDNFLHYAVIGDNAKIIEFTWNEITDTVNSCSKIQKTSKKLEEIQKSKGQYGRNLLQNAAVNSENIETFEFLWNFFRNLYDSDEKFLEFLEDVDDEGNNIFDLTVSFASVEILNFMIDLLEELTTPQKIKEFLSSTGFSKLNLLQTAGCENKSLEFHECLWMIMRKYFDSNEILQMITNSDKDGNNLLHCIVISDNSEIIELTWKQITDTVNSCSKINNASKKLDEIQKSKGQHGRNLLQNASINSKNLKTFELLWNLFKKSFDSNENFMEFLRNVDNEGRNIFDLAASFASSEILMVMIDMLKELTTHQKIKEFLSSTGSFKRNLLQAAGSNNKSLKSHKCLWMIIKTYFDSDEIFEMITYTDENGDNLLHYVVFGDSIEIFEFTWNEIIDIVDSCSKIQYKSSELEKIQKSKGQYGRNLLQNTASNSKNVKTFKFFWNFFQKLFNSDEKFMEFLKNTDDEGRNIFDLAASFASSEILKIMIELMNELSTPQKIKEFLCSTGSSERNMLQAAGFGNKSLEFHKCLWMIMRNYFDFDEILEMTTYKDKNGDDLLHCAILGDNAEIIEHTWNEITTTVNSCIKIKNKSRKLEEILKSKGNHHQNLLQHVVRISKNKETHQCLWNILLSIFDSFEDFIWDQTNLDGNILHIAINNANKEICEYTWTQIIKLITKKEDQVRFLRKTDPNGLNILELSINNSLKDFEVNEWVQQVLIEYNVQFPDS